jgi:hypothetical protein
MNVGTEIAGRVRFPFTEEKGNLIFRRELLVRGGGWRHPEVRPRPWFYSQRRAVPGRLQVGRGVDMVAADRVTAGRVTADRVTAGRRGADRVTADRVTGGRVTRGKVTAGDCTVGGMTA